MRLILNIYIFIGLIFMHCHICTCFGHFCDCCAESHIAGSFSDDGYDESFQLSHCGEEAMLSQSGLAYYVTDIMLVSIAQNECVKLTSNYMPDSPPPEFFYNFVS